MERKPKKDNMSHHLPSNQQNDDSIFGLAGYFALAMIVVAIVNAVIGA